MQQFISASSALVAARIVALLPIAFGGFDNGDFTPIGLAVLVGGSLWSVGTGSMHLLGGPSSLRWVRLICVGDALFAIALALAGMVVSPLAITALLALNWVSFGGRPQTVLPIVVTALTACLSLFVLRWMNGYRHHNNIADFLLQPLVVLFAVAACANFLWVRAELRRLGASFDFAELMSIDLPFAFQLDSWLASLAGIFGGKQHSLCAIVLTDAEGLGQVHSSREGASAQEADIAAMMQLAGDVGPALHLCSDHASAPAASRESIALVNAVRLFAHQMHAPGDRDRLLVRSLAIGRMRGIMIISHSMRVDDALRVLTAGVDRALDLLLRKLRNTLAARRHFLAEAREISRRDLHDGVLQTLAALRMRLSISARNAAQVDDRLANDLRRTSEIVSLEQARLRALLESGAEADQPVNLIDTLNICLRTISLQWNIEATMATEEIAIATDRETAANIEHLVREIVANSSRHSASQKATLGLAMRENMLILTLRDYGGDNSAETEKNSVANPMASRSLKQRLALVNGEAYWEDVTTGTLLAINIPLIEDIETE